MTSHASVRGVGISTGVGDYMVGCGARNRFVSREERADVY